MGKGPSKKSGEKREERGQGRAGKGDGEAREKGMGKEKEGDRGRKEEGDREERRKGMGKERRKEMGQGDGEQEDASVTTSLDHKETIWSGSVSPSHRRPGN